MGNNHIYNIYKWWIFQPNVWLQEGNMTCWNHHSPPSDDIVTPSSDSTDLQKLILSRRQRSPTCVLNTKSQVQDDRPGILCPYQPKKVFVLEYVVIKSHNNIVYIYILNIPQDTLMIGSSVVVSFYNTTLFQSKTRSSSHQYGKVIHHSSLS
jgi:hypothetical protein